MNTELIQIVNIIQYRLEKSMLKADAEYYDFKLGNESRSPNEILSHLVDVSNYGLGILNAPKSSTKETGLLNKVNANFIYMKSFLLKEVIDDNISKRLINGPLSDTLTHIGQLAFLRRLQGSPIEHENFSKANI